MNNTPCKLSLGPVPYYWPAQKLWDFYTQAAGWPLDIVCLGETVCAKRRALTPREWLAIADMLAAAGKEVVLSTLALVEAESELGAMRRLCANARYPVEANDMAAVHMLSEQGVEFVTGPGLNIYNPRTLAVLAGLGLRRWVPPVELSGESIASLHRARPPGVQTELFAYGRMPLAWSARCFTARAHGLGKDDCGFRCLDDPDGRLVRTRDGEPFVVLNGIMTQSARTLCLLGELPAIRDLGIEVLRISPQWEYTACVVAAHDRARSGAHSEPAADALDRYMPAGRCHGYWYGSPGMALRAP